MAMWRPAERIRHTPQPGPWPSEQRAGASRLFAPIHVGRLRLGGRTWVPAMVPWRATETGEVTQNVLDWYARFARGRPAALVVEATGIRDIPSGPLLRIGDDRFLPGLRRLVDIVRRESAGETRLFIQLIDFLRIRRRPDVSRYLGEFLRITGLHGLALGMQDANEAEIRRALLALDEDAIARVLEPRELEAMRFGERERVTDLHLDHVRTLPETLPPAFAAAASRAEAAGFDGVELHYAHAYTMASFLSALNDRTDGYGSTREGRVRLPREVLQRVRESVGEHFVVGCRMLTEETIADGSTIEDASYYATELARTGLDFLSLSRGGKFEDANQPKPGEAAYPYTGPSGYECMPSRYSDARGPFGRNLAPVRAVRQALRDAGLATPVVASGGIYAFEQAEGVLARGDADIVGLARQALADPDWFRKVRSGHGDAVRVCIYSNYCEALDQRHREVTCELWDREALDEPGVVRSNDRKRRLIPPEWL